MSVIGALVFSVGLTLYLVLWAALLIIPINLNIERDWPLTKTIPTALAVMSAFILVTIILGESLFA